MFFIHLFSNKNEGDHFCFRFLSRTLRNQVYNLLSSFDFSFYYIFLKVEVPFAGFILIVLSFQLYILNSKSVSSITSIFPFIFTGTMAQEPLGNFFHLLTSLLFQKSKLLSLFLSNFFLSNLSRGLLSSRVKMKMLTELQS